MKISITRSSGEELRVATLVCIEEMQIDTWVFDDTSYDQMLTDGRLIDDESREQMYQLFLRLGNHLSAKFGEEQATIRAHMLLDAYGPARNIDPKVLFKQDSDGDEWADAINNLSF